MTRNWKMFRVVLKWRRCFGRTTCWDWQTAMFLNSRILLFKWASLSHLRILIAMRQPSLSTPFATMPLPPRPRISWSIVNCCLLRNPQIACTSSSLMHIYCFISSVQRGPEPPIRWFPPTLLLLFTYPCPLLLLLARACCPNQKKQAFQSNRSNRRLVGNSEESIRTNERESKRAKVKRDVRVIVNQANLKGGWKLILSWHENVLFFLYLPV